LLFPYFANDLKGVFLDIIAMRVRLANNAKLKMLKISSRQPVHKYGVAGRDGTKELGRAGTRTTDECSPGRANERLSGNSSVEILAELAGATFS
jgi:hypothetical protein